MKNMQSGIFSLTQRAGIVISYTKRGAATFNPETGKATSTDVVYSVRAFVRNYSPREIMGLLAAGDREVRLAAKDLPFTPAKGDTVAVGSDSFRVFAINKIGGGSVDLIYILSVRGGE
jgi:hypothetical protein